MKPKDLEKLIEELEVLKNTLEMGKDYDAFRSSKFDTVRASVYDPNKYRSDLIEHGKTK